MLHFRQWLTSVIQCSDQNPAYVFWWKGTVQSFLILINFGLLDHQRERRRFFPNPIHTNLWTDVRCFSLSDCCFILSSAASGNIQTVQLLCELKSPVNLKDAVRTFIITSTLVFPDLFFLAAQEEALTEWRPQKMLHSVLSTLFA